MLVAAIGVAGGFAYVYKLKADNAILKANQIQLETAINEQQEVITQQKESYENILTTNKELRAIEQTYLNKANRQLAEARSSTKGRRRLVRSNKSIMTREKDYDLKSRTKLRTY